MQSVLFWSTVGASFVVSLLSCRALRAFAAKRALVDFPNERSLHSLPVPRLGGVGVFLGCWPVTVAALLLANARPASDVTVWLVASIPVAGLGLVDDVRSVRAGTRLVIQLSIAALITLAVGPPNLTMLAAGLTVAIPSFLTFPLWVLWIVGVLNIYNFMDGMDGLAGSQATFAGIAVSIGFYVHGHLDLALVSALLAAANAGFLTLNAPPAKIFMGDAGSTFVGFTFGVLALLGAARPDPLPLFVTPLALAPFLLDGTFTLVRRALRGEAVWTAHRSHLYQRAVTSGLRHRQVLLRYSSWMLAAAACAVGAATSGAAVTFAVSLLMVAALGLVWRWVVARERASAS